jgi:hypothetical protein
VIDAIRRRGRIQRLSLALLALGCRRRSALLVSVAWSLATLRVHVGSGVSHRFSRRLVVLHKLGGTEDIAAAAESAGAGRTLEVVSLPRDHVRAVFEALVGRPAFPTLMDLSYRPGDPSVEEEKLRYRAFLRRVMRHYRRWMRVACIVTPNVSFRAERELAAASVEESVPFLALHKESIRTTAQRPWFTRTYRELTGPFVGTAIGVYNEDERRSLIDAGMAGPDDVVVVGCPRMDTLHRLRGRTPHPASLPGAPVVLFSVDIRAGAWTPFDGLEPVEAPRWERCAELVEAAFLAAAARNPDRPFVVKTKIGREEQQVGRLPADLPENVTVVRGGLGTGLLERASVVIGLNSTVLLEAIAAGIPTIVPRLAEAAEGSAEPWLFQLGHAIVAAHDPEELVVAIEDALALGPIRDLSDEAVAALERYVGNSDGCAGRRAWDLIVSRSDV